MVIPAQGVVCFFEHKDFMGFAEYFRFSNSVPTHIERTTNLSDYVTSSRVSDTLELVGSGQLDVLTQSDNFLHPYLPADVKILTIEQVEHLQSLCAKQNQAA